MGAIFQTGVVPAGMADACSVVDPVRLEGVRVMHKGASEIVRLTEAPLLACEMAVATTQWVQESVAPLTRGHFSEALLELGVGGGLQCRMRNRQMTGARSEHSYGRALDIMTFRTPDRTVKVEKARPAERKPFLDAVWASACGRFSTVLGPNADAFHATHFHVDLQPRRSNSSKFCE